jgi:carboxyl-terminal processing protease
MRTSTFLAIALPLIGCILAIGGAFAIEKAAEARASEGLYWDDDIALFVRRAVGASYVDPVTEEKSRELFNAAMAAYVRSLPDEYNDYISPERYRKWKDETAGHYAGIGVKIKAQPDGLVVDGVFPAGPADRAGLRIGDVVTAVDGRSFANADLSRDSQLRLLKGPAGSRITLTVKSPLPPGAPAGAVPAHRAVDVVRADIRPPTVFARRLDADRATGYLRVTEFTEATAADFDRELDAMVAAGVARLVVDLRGNPGGVLSSTEQMADRLVASGEIVRIVGRTPNSTRTRHARADGTIPPTVALVVLVDGGSASASEVFAGCMQDHRRGVVVGTRTYGKFLVQNITEVLDRGAAVKLTTARYMTPLGRWYTRDPKASKPAGLIPDLVVPLSEDDEATFHKARENADEAVWGGKSPHPEVPADWVDPQLRAAIDHLAGRPVVQKIEPSKSTGG